MVASIRPSRRMIGPTTAMLSTPLRRPSVHLHRPTTQAGENAAPEHGRWLLAILLVAQLMVILDITAVNIAMPSIAKDLSISGNDISWTITSYSLIFGSLLLLGGRAADVLGRRRLFLTGLGVLPSHRFSPRW